LPNSLAPDRQPAPQGLVGRRPDPPAHIDRSQLAERRPRGAQAPPPQRPQPDVPAHHTRLDRGPAIEQRPHGTLRPLSQRLPPDVRAHYTRLNLQVTRDTLLAYNDSQVIGRPAELGSGAFNSVYSVKLRSNKSAPVEGVFKPLRSTESGWVANHTGISRHNPQLAMRNIATVAYAKKLGFDVIGNAKVALLTVPGTGASPQRPQLGLLMDPAPGETAKETAANVLARPDVMREVTKLQLLDHLTAQGDRHYENYFVHVDGNNRAKVTGIDNDQCFGKNALSPEAIRYADTPERKGFRGTRLPPAVDHEMAIAISSIQASDLQEMLGDKLSASEVQAAVQRLAGVKQHIAKLDQQGLVISPDEWSHANVQQALSPNNSYARRDLAGKLKKADAPPAQAGW
jgi:hypothetical protein